MEPRKEALLRQLYGDKAGKIIAICKAAPKGPYKPTPPGLVLAEMPRRKNGSRS